MPGAEMIRVLRAYSLRNSAVVAILMAELDLTTEEANAAVREYDTQSADRADVTDAATARARRGAPA